ncbi:MAG: L,D-transpeptidase [Anaerolineae bacterium]|nr:L,D-transpeptidase [Anaerolineae bacterium]
MNRRTLSCIAHWGVCSLVVIAALLAAAPITWRGAIASKQTLPETGLHGVDMTGSAPVSGFQAAGYTVSRSEVDVATWITDQISGIYSDDDVEPVDSVPLGGDQVVAEREAIEAWLEQEVESSSAVEVANPESVLDAVPHAQFMVGAWVVPTPLPTPRPMATAEPGGIVPPTVVGKALVVDQAAQALRVYENGVEVRTLPVSTGVRGRYTPAFRGYVGYYVASSWGYGTYFDNAWYVTEAAGAILIHGAPYVYVDGEKVYQDLSDLGVRPASHGCVRLHPDDAAWLRDWNPRGAPIVITPPSFARN